ncbi:hypothetical protein [Micromonospora sp. NPDC023644]|uniref:hypothetical protein n=1 Tax=Micromonospora sp. NPDC023644 TaxID=3154321 RepID=UPI0033D7A97D
MGLTVEQIHRSIKNGDDARQRVRSNYYPRNFAGVTMWGETLAGLRRELVKTRQGWQIGYTGNYETVYSEERRLAFAVVAADRYTGKDETRHPKLKRKRGPKTKQRIDRNVIMGQLALDLEIPEFAATLPPDEACQTWFLLVHPTDDEIRIEVSLATEVDDDGFVGSWIERILMEPVAISGAIAPVQPDEDDDDGDTLVTRPA